MPVSTPGVLTDTRAAISLIQCRPLGERSQQTGTDPAVTHLMPKGPDKVSPYSKASATEHTATYWEANPRLWERPLLRVRYGQVPKAADHLRGPSRLATKKQRLYWHQLHPAPGGRRDPGRASQHTMARIRPRAFPFCQLSVMDNFQSGELLVGNQPRKTKPEKRIDPRLVGYRFVSALD